MRWLVTFNLVVFGWILFRSQDLSLFWTYLTRMVQPGPFTLFSAPAALALVAVIGLQLLPERTSQGIEVRIERLSPILLGAALAALILIVGATVPSQGVPPFIYFRF